MQDIQFEPDAPSHMRNWARIAGSAILLLVLVYGSYTWWRTTHTSVTSQVVDTQQMFEEGDLDGSIQQLDAILAKDSNNVQALIAKSLILAQTGSITFQEDTFGAQAADLANQAIAINGNSSEAYRALGYANEIQQKYVAAHAAYQKALELNPKNGLALYGDAHSYDLQGDSEKAEAGYKAAAALDPELYSAYLGIGRAENAKGNSDAAIDAFKKVYGYSQNKHEKSEAAYSIGMLLLAKGGQVNLARGYFEKAISFDPTYPSAYLGQGTVLYMQAGTNAEVSADVRGNLLLSSASALQKATQLNPNQSLAYFQLAQTLYMLGEINAAHGAIDSAKQALPHDITLSATEKTGTLKNIEAFEESIK
jgi:tetratricopeptide (TPR) repeat protein